jgi:5-methylthioribose kinase
VCLKQSLPYVRCVGEGWPLSQDRARIEAEALQLEQKLCPEHVPEVGPAFLPDRSLLCVSANLLALFRQQLPVLVG